MWTVKGRSLVLRFWCFKVDGKFYWCVGRFICKGLWFMCLWLMAWSCNVFTKSVVSSAIYEQTIFFLNGDRNLFERLWNLQKFSDWVGVVYYRIDFYLIFLNQKKMRNSIFFCNPLCKHKVYKNLQGFGCFVFTFYLSVNYLKTF